MVSPSLKLMTSSGLRTIKDSVCVDLSQVDRLLDPVLVDTLLIWILVSTDLKCSPIIPISVSVIEVSD